jgi:hypothetical protein
VRGRGWHRLKLTYPCLNGSNSRFCYRSEPSSK